MRKGEVLDHLAADRESRLALARVLDKAEYARSRNAPAHSQFLSDGERALARQALAAAGVSRYRFWGGYPEAERQVCLFLPDWADEDDPTAGEEPLAAVEAVPPREAELSHRDYLGALMGLGLSRDNLGDLLTGPEGCQAVCLRGVLPTLLSQWSQAGRYPLRVREIPLDALRPERRGGTLRRETFQSLRFDAVAAAGFRLSRARAAALIAGGQVQLNHLPCVKPDRLLEPGDSLTARGYGKCVLVRVTGESRKGRIQAELERYE